MSGDLTVRRYDPADADEVWAVHEAALRASPLPFVEDAPTDDDLTAIAERYLDAGGEFLVGLADGRVVAIGGYRPVDDGTVEVRRMRVRPAYQRRGYGERLLHRLETSARERGFERAVLHTAERLRAARALYESNHYEERRRAPHPETGEPIVHYEKDLTSHALG